GEKQSVTVQEKEIDEKGHKREGESLEQEIAKKQRMDEEEEELKRHLQIMANNDDDVYTKATPLASKNFDREDLKTFWKLVKERFKTTGPKNFSDDFFLNTFKIMFEKPNVEANKYPLTHFTLQQMLDNVRVEVEEESKMSLELLRGKGFESCSPLNENCSAVILKKLLEKLGDPRKFLIPCGFSGLKCKALADLGKFTFPADFFIVDYESDPRVPLILGRPCLRTACALIDVHRKEMILRDGDERLTLYMRHDTSSYSNQPQKESINMINIYDDSCADFLKDLFATSHLSGKPTFSSHSDLTSTKVKDDIFDPKGDIVLIEKLLNIDATKDLPPPHNINPLRTDDLPFDIESDLKEIEYLINHDPTKEMDSILEDSIDKENFADLNDNLFDTMPEMFNDEHTLDYSSPPLYDEYDDDPDEFESDTDDAYNDPFDSKEEKINESKLLIDELDSLRSKVLGSETLLSFSSENEEKVFKPEILTSKGVHSSLLLELSHRGPKDFKVTKIVKSPMEIFPCSFGEDILILDVPCLHFYSL
nr:hypothetical protein [Tanacetum cinerariifolium]